MLLRLAYLALMSLFSLVWLLPMSGVGKNLGVLALRQQLSILQHQIDKPRLTTPARAFLRRLPPVRLRRLHQIVPPDTIWCRHRDPMRRRHANACCKDHPGPVGSHRVRDHHFGRGRVSAFVGEGLVCGVAVM